MELEQFAESILEDKQTPVPIEEGFLALHVAHQVMEKLNSSLNVFA